MGLNTGDGTVTRLMTVCSYWLTANLAGVLSSLESRADEHKQHTPSHLPTYGHAFVCFCIRVYTHQHILHPKFSHTAAFSVALSFMLWCSTNPSSVHMQGSEVKLATSSRQTFLISWVSDYHERWEMVAVRLGLGTKTTCTLLCFTYALGSDRMRLWIQSEFPLKGG